MQTKIVIARGGPIVDIVLVDMKTTWKVIVQRVVSNAAEVAEATEAAVRYFVLYMLFYLTNWFLAENGNKYITIAQSWVSVFFNRQHRYQYPSVLTSGPTGKLRDSSLDRGCYIYIYIYIYITADSIVSAFWASSVQCWCWDEGEPLKATSSFPQMW